MLTNKDINMMNNAIKIRKPPKKCSNFLNTLILFDGTKKYIKVTANLLIYLVYPKQMEIYLLPTLEDYVLFAEIEKKEYKGPGKGLVAKFHEYEKKWVEEENLKGKGIMYLRKRLETKHELILRHANKSEEIILKYPSSMDDKNLQENLRRIYSHKRTRRKARMISYGILAPVTFVSAPFLPILNWGVTAFLIYKFVVNYNVLKGSKKLLENCKYVPDDKLSKLEEILSKEKDYSKLAEESKKNGYEFLVRYYTSYTKQDD